MKYRITVANNYEIWSLITAPILTPTVINEAIKNAPYKIQYKKYLFWRDYEKDGNVLFFDDKEKADEYLQSLIMHDFYKNTAKEIIDNVKPLDGDIQKFVDDNFWDLI